MKPSPVDMGAASNRSEPSIPELDASRFELLEAIGSGGMGTVYKALQRSVGRHVAVKMLAPEHAANATGLVRFVREANAIARMAHPNIVQLIDFGRDADNRMLLVMELLEGESLRALLRRERTLEPDRAAWVTVQCLNALRTAHAAGVIHRDLKPENIFIHRAGGEDHVKVLDFGVAKLTQSDVGEHTTQGSLVGTLRYMAPEQIAGDPPDPRIDVYAMGVLLYEMLSGSVPYDTRDRFVLLRQIIAEEPTPLAARAPHLPADLCAVVMHALVKNPRDRFESAEAFRRALLPFLASEAARSQLLSDAGGRVPVSPQPIEGSGFRSGIVRATLAPVLEAATLAGRLEPRTGATPPGSTVPTDAPTEHLALPSHAPRRPRWVLPVAITGALVMAVTGVTVGWLYSTSETPSSPGARPVAVAQPVAPPTPTRATLPAPPVVVPAPVATRMVVVSTVPSGARVLDADGTVLCAATPCAIPVSVEHGRSVRVVYGTAAVGAVLEASQPTVALDLSGLTQAPAPAAQGHPPRAPDRPRPPRPRHGGSAGDGESSLPMFLPGGGH